jgi:hypothetical protein
MVNNMNKYSVMPVFEYSDDEMVDIISAAVYDIGYWSVIDNDTDVWNAMSDSLDEDHTFEDVFYAILKNGQAVQLIDVEDIDEIWDLTLEKLLNGIKLAIQNGYWNGKIDDIDGEVGDIVFQYALFSEIVYG